MPLTQIKFDPDSCEVREVYRLLTPSASDCQTRRASGGILSIEDAARTTVKRTVPGAFTASETFDVSVDLGSPVSLDYFDR